MTIHNINLKAERITSYDIFRGVLLIAMVIFHIVVNLTKIEFDQNYFYWVPLGFMLFLGVILGQFLNNKNKKTFILGSKLLIIFLILNIPNLISKNFNFEQLLVGNQNLFSFEILFPMSIATFLSIGLNRFIKKRTSALFISITLISILSYFNFINFYSYNLSFVIYGIIGYLIGKNINLNKFAQQITSKFLLIIILASLIPFLIINHTGIIEILIISQVLAFFIISSKLFNKNKFLEIIGKNSLILYVIHIVLIKIIS